MSAAELRVAVRSRRSSDRFRPAAIVFKFRPSQVESPDPGSVPPILHRQESQCHLPGLCGLGKSHLATALGYAACQQGYSVLFANAIDVINTLSAAQSQGALKGQLRRYLSPQMLILDEVVRSAG